MLEFEEALARVLAAVPAPTREIVSLSEAAGRVLAEPIRSPLDLPSFDNSAMDGYALRAADVTSAKPESPVSLRLTGKVRPETISPAALRPALACVCSRAHPCRPAPTPL